jgi:hypothetical protein
LPAFELEGALGAGGAAFSVSGEFALALFSALGFIVVELGVLVAPVVAHVDVALPLVPDVVWRGRRELARGSLSRGRVVGGVFGVVVCVEVAGGAGAVEGDPVDGLFECVG